MGDLTRHLADDDLDHMVSHSGQAEDLRGNTGNRSDAVYTNEAHAFLLVGDFDVISEPGSTLQVPEIRVIHEGAPWHTHCVILHMEAAIWATAQDVESIQRLYRASPSHAAEHGRQTQ